MGEVKLPHIHMHFEDIWNESEKISTESEEECLIKIKYLIDELPKSPDSIGLILYYISCLSKIYNIDVYSQLSLVVSNKKIDTWG